MDTSLKFNQLQQFNASEWAAKLPERAPKWVALALVAVIGWQVAMMIASLFSGAPKVASADPQVAAAPGATPASRSTAVNISAITNAHLFGIADAQPVEAVQDTEIVETELRNLVLKGTIAADDPDYALAIIADNNKLEKVYAVRDTIASGTTLHAVEKDRVILNRSGRLEALKLPQEYSAGGRTSSRRRTTARASAAPIRSADSGSVRDVITQNVSSLTDVIRPQPYFSGGKQKGYRVYPGKDRKKFSDLGLRPGDLVTEINGTAMTDPRQGMEVFRSLGDATSVSVIVERNGQPETLTLSTDQLNQ